MHKLHILTQDDYIRIGRGIGSDLIHREAEEAIARWERDAAVLTNYGFTPEGLSDLRALFQSHGNLITERSHAIAAKKAAVETRDLTIHAVWTWMEQVAAIIGVASMTNPELVNRFNEIYPEDDGDLWRAIAPMAALLAELKESISSAVPVQALIEEASALRDRMVEIFGRTEAAKAAPMADTLEIDELDGRLYVIVRELNSAGRRAIRAGRLTRQPPHYRFNHLRKAPRPTPNPDTPA